MNKAALALSLFLAFAFTAFAETGYEYQLDIKKRTGLYSQADLSFDQVIIAITKLNYNDTTDDQDRYVAALFENGETLWAESGRKQNMVLSSQFGYKKLCDAVISYYVATGRLYKAVPYFKKLIAESERIYLLDVEADTLGRLADVYLSLGQTELAGELIDRFKSIADEYFEVDTADIDGSDPYCVVLNSELMKYRVRLALLNGKGKNLLKEASGFFDFLMKFYGAYFYTPFMQMTGLLNTEASFVQYDKDTIADNFYYTNYEMLYYMARLFAANGDRKRAELALGKAETAVKSNGGGDVTSVSILKADSTAHKEISFAGGVTSTEPAVLKRVRYRYSYLASLYKAVILSELGDMDKASADIKDSEKRYGDMTAYYSTLPREYANNDRISDDLPQQILTEARIAKSRKNFAEADRDYERLISHYETVRASMPVALRRGFFRGYSKGAYLGLIENRAQMYLAGRDRNGFAGFIKAVDMMNARQFRELSGEALSAMDTLDAVQASLSKDDLIYLILDTEKNIVTAGITHEKTGVNIIPKDPALELSLKNFKDALVHDNAYDMDKLAKLTGGIMNPITGYKNKGNIHALIDGAVSILPLSIYPTGGKMIFENYDVDYMVTLEKLKERTVVASNLNFLGIADPVYDNKTGVRVAQVKVSAKRSAAISGYFDPLPETRQEVRDIAAGMPASKLLLGTNAAESVVKNMPLSGYSIIHFATHGILGGEIPGVDEPALVLSGEKGEDSLLTASEISKLNLKANLVVLSACNTGSGKYFRGEGVTGIARAFKLAGTDTVVASLWPVDSMATKNLMELFYKYIEQGKPVPQALYMAKNKLRTESAGKAGAERALKSRNTAAKDFTGYSNPYYWSAFVCISS